MGVRCFLKTLFDGWIWTWISVAAGAISGVLGCYVVRCGQLVIRSLSSNTKPLCQFVIRYRLLNHLFAIAGMASMAPYLLLLRHLFPGRSPEPYTWPYALGLAGGVFVGWFWALREFG